jgi:phage tail-like protein
MRAKMTLPRQDPPPFFRFIVEWDDQRVGFSEVDGLTQENQTIEKIPGLSKFTNVTLKRGIIKDNDFAEWLSTVKSNALERRDLVISLLNEVHRPVMVWKIDHAWPVKVEGVPDLKASGNEVAIESIEIAHEGLELQRSTQRRSRTKKT